MLHGPSEMKDPSPYPTTGQVIRRAVGDKETTDTSTPEPEELSPPRYPSALQGLYIRQDLWHPTRKFVRRPHSITKYSQPYSHGTSTADVQQYSVGASPYSYAILGARYGASGDFKLAALGDYDAVFTATSSTSIANENRGTYWYYYSSKSMGFAPNPYVSLGSADTAEGSSKARLSWHFGSGGYRAGSTSDSTANLYMVVLYCNDLS